LYKIHTLLHKCTKSENLGVTFIYGFLILFIVCALQKVLNYTNPSGNTIIYAYYLLAIGVILQISEQILQGTKLQKKSETLLQNYDAYICPYTNILELSTEDYTEIENSVYIEYTIIEYNQPLPITSEEEE
jgi:hypothetical protein